MNCSILAQALLSLENDQLKQKILKIELELNALKSQYLSLEEDFLHSLKRKPSLSLKGKKIVYISDNSNSIKQYKDITKSYQAELIILSPENNNDASICRAIEAADEVVCPQDCQNEKLCYLARSNCTKFNKPFRGIKNSSPQIFQEELANIAIQIQ
jgi:hypothetical protein